MAVLRKIPFLRKAAGRRKLPGKEEMRNESKSIYEVLILDIDEGIRGVYEIIRMCKEIHVAVIKEEVAQAKMFQFEEELHLMGYDDVRHKMIKKELEG